MGMKKILLVDDSITVRMVMRKIITDLELDVLEAENGQEALKVLQQHKDVSAVLLDWNMPIMDGMGFLKELRKLCLSPKPKVVMCTSENELASILTAIQNGADEYIMKPFNEEIVRDKLQIAGVL